MMAVGIAGATDLISWPGGTGNVLPDGLKPYWTRKLWDPGRQMLAYAQRSA